MKYFIPLFCLVNIFHLIIYWLTVTVSVARAFTLNLQINRRMEFVFASHSFDVWESWTFEGSLEECRLVNCRNPLVRPIISAHYD